VTGIVSGLIFYRYQRNIQDRLDRQKFVFETKVGQGFVKTVETLENLHRMFGTYARAYTKVIGQMVNEHINNSLADISVYSQKLGDTRKLLEDYGDYFDENRRYIPKNRVHEIEEIFGKAVENYENVCELSQHLFGNALGAEDTIILTVSWQVYDLADKLEEIFRSLVEVDYSKA
jgi:hypothetical protein